MRVSSKMVRVSSWATIIMAVESGEVEANGGIVMH